MPVTFESFLPFSFFQKTVESPCSCEGIGVHSGQSISLVLRPAPINTGIVFKRTDQHGASSSVIPVCLNAVVDTRMCTTVGNEEGLTVGTIEHLMAALYACEIDNCVVEVSGAEIPVMDGSARPFIQMIEEVGVVEQRAPRSYLRVLEPIEVVTEQGMARLKPSDYPLYRATYDFKGRADFGSQVFTYDGTPESFKREIAEARTFGHLEDAERIWKMGLAKGSSLENTVVIHENRVLNEEGLRFADEFVRHKILDTVGDFYTSGFPILAEFEGINGGHALNHLILKKLFSDCHFWEVVTPHAQMDDFLVGVYSASRPSEYLRA